MSTGANCRFVEEKPRQWFYYLQRYPYGETDEYDKEGPFQTFKEAHAHLGRHHANPGSFTISALPDCPHDLVTLTPDSGWRYAECDRCGHDFRNKEDLEQWQKTQSKRPKRRAPLS